MTDPAERIVGLYDDKAEGWIADRDPILGSAGKSIAELDAMERFAGALTQGTTVLDVGCGSGWPWGSALIDRGFRVTGVDSSPRLIAHATRTLPQGEWIVGDMRTFDLGRTFDGILIWYSLFHLTPDDQHVAMERILAHTHAGSVLVLTIAEDEGVAIGAWRGEPLYHASLGAETYRVLLSHAGFERQPHGGADLSWEATASMFRRRSECPSDSPDRSLGLDRGSSDG